MLGQYLAKRSIHIAPRLAHERAFAQAGVKGLMSPAQFQTAWIDHQNYLTKNLTLKTVDTEYETKSPLAITLATAKKPLQGDIFHYASMAHNNHLFFQQLKDNELQTPVDESEIKPQLLENIKSTFVSLDNFRNEFLYTADVMSGNGWVFLVEDENKKLKIVSCNNDGTPYFYGRNQPINLNTAFDYADYEPLLQHKDSIKAGKKDYSLPIICANVWEHAYLLDYGVTGKDEYLERLWNNIDWNVVNSRVFSNIAS
jgi:Fe-Mn family superoxide dismutase